MTRKTYRGAALDVSFEKDLCIHAGECVRGLPSVFDTERRPWILPDGAEAEAVRDVVGRCPTGALAVEEHASGEAPEEASVVSIRVLPGGPLMVDGPFELVGEDGTPVQKAAKVALCRCGRSATSPFCDGSHARA